MNSFRKLSRYRAQALSVLEDMITGIRKKHPLRVGIDGVSASGKTILADQLAGSLEARGCEVIRASIDGFHNPREIRYRRGRGSYEGYYFDSFNNRAVVSNLLEPLGSGGDLKYTTRSFDFRSDTRVDSSLLTANPGAILIFEGVFLHRPELRKYWDLSIFVHADFKTTVKRAQTRDLDLFNSPEEIKEMYELRYIPGEKIYLNAEDPASKAHIIWNNNNPDEPVLELNNRMQENKQIFLRTALDE